MAAVFALTLLQSAAAQGIQEFTIPTANSAPTGIVAGPDGALWFTESSSKKIGRVATDGTIAEFTIPTASTPNQIAVGADGALWFTSAFAIGRVTTAGVFSEYKTGISAFVQPNFITPGPDGNLWFTETSFSFNTNKIGRITPSGTITEFVVSTYVGQLIFGNSDLQQIIAGPDGALWFAYSMSNQIGRITTDGIATVPGKTQSVDATGSIGPYGIAAGPDGALWFTHPFANTIGRVTVNAALKEFPASQGNSMISGPDGALWFAETGDGKIGRSDINGNTTDFAIPTANSGVSGIAAGPDGAIWFTERAANKVGRLSTVALTVAAAGNGQITSSTGTILCSASSSQCSAAVLAGAPITLTASAQFGSVFTGWNGGGCSGSSPCQLSPAADTNVTATFAVAQSHLLSISPMGSGTVTVTSDPSGINCGTVCNASFADGTQVTLSVTSASDTSFSGWSGGACTGTAPCTVTVTGDTSVTASFSQTGGNSRGALVAAVLPLSRSAVIGNPVTAFATIMNADVNGASTCAPALATPIPAAFAYQTTDPQTNAVTGTPNTPASFVPPGKSQTYVIALTPSATIPPTNVAFSFACSTAGPAPTVTGIDTLLLSASATPVPDIIAVAATADPGYVDISPTAGTGDFAVATANVGAAGQITVSADSGSGNLPVVVQVCQTNPTSGTCLAPPAATSATTIAANATPTFGIFVTGLDVVQDLPALNRVFVRFTDSGGAIRGQTSVAVRTH
jgi:virginiamycin B lyase